MKLILNSFLLTLSIVIPAFAQNPYQYQQNPPAPNTAYPPQQQPAMQQQPMQPMPQQQGMQPGMQQPMPQQGMQPQGMTQPGMPQQQGTQQLPPIKPETLCGDQPTCELIAGTPSDFFRYFAVCPKLGGATIKWQPLPVMNINIKTYNGISCGMDVTI